MKKKKRYFEYPLTNDVQSRRESKSMIKQPQCRVNEIDFINIFESPYLRTPTNLEVYVVWG